MKVLVLGATGSIGKQAIDVICRLNYELVGFSYYKNHSEAKNIINQLNPGYVLCHSDNKHNKNIKSDLIELIDKSKPKVVINAINGSAGIEASLITLSKKKDLLLANKESLIIAGKQLNLIKKNAKTNIFPIDSEHTSLYDLIKNTNKKQIKELIITASGSRYFNLPKSELKKITYQDAINHPNWNMGEEISINSATFINKVYEIVEAYHLFQIAKITPVVEKTSTIHAGVIYQDNSIHLHASTNDMRWSIQSALTQFNNKNNIVRELDIYQKQIKFEKIDFEQYPVFKIAYDILKNPSTTRGAVLVCINEFALNLFRNNKINFLQISELIIDFYWNYKHKKIDDIWQINDLIFKIKEEISTKYSHLSK
ncbi:NAD-dependent epimerase/dehydratase family protein [Mycoplasma sp. T363T]|uniref:1-deoxy-D-xylulose 5-phosphate reductoisomerase n=1 Tax=Mycoplasma bradburyae TaxID=2963128 RepID=A0AAW6HPA1_9MOLU|nr:NAD-dependent epimerase/dehydratase family protein [Mycoplasma bradburyae]MDC4163127.1 NAD-dependent epimerase/dehydratase family protein [Mycoplasma bradburyae]MDC4181736.1 NAD-dependent epimerase/dehydratase family protein [Mycoplasma bradburyae]MDC4182443.1 NAD-dependent epimerase/dehydratase family protein [Mycoplasma bradburyae]MDC4183662.1 NAD-dependent epimerase/dehydratase family protein [Mycoplasma bradburyae]UTS70218.1 NAD-dependent epimerase/dehydratase family protein [Mycoplasma